MIDPGTQAHRMIIKSANTSQDSRGGETEGAPTSVEIIWLSMLPLDGREVRVGDQVIASADYRMRGYHTTNAVVEDVLVYGSRSFQIVHVANLKEEDAEMELLCTELK